MFYLKYFAINITSYFANGIIMECIPHSKLVKHEHLAQNLATLKSHTKGILYKKTNLITKNLT